MTPRQPRGHPLQKRASRFRCQFLPRESAGGDEGASEPRFISRRTARRPHHSRCRHPQRHHQRRPVADGFQRVLARGRAGRRSCQRLCGSRPFRRPGWRRCPREAGDPVRDRLRAARGAEGYPGSLRRGCDRRGLRASAARRSHHPSDRVRRVQPRAVHAHSLGCAGRRARAIRSSAARRARRMPRSSPVSMRRTSAYLARAPAARRRQSRSSATSLPSRRDRAAIVPPPRLSSDFTLQPSDFTLQTSLAEAV